MAFWAYLFNQNLGPSVDPAYGLMLESLSPVWNSGDLVFVDPPPYSETIASKTPVWSTDSDQLIAV